MSTDAERVESRKAAETRQEQEHRTQSKALRATRGSEQRGEYSLAHRLADA
jgi:hypothetical protein